MRRQINLAVLTLALAGANFLAASEVYAHHPEITAQVVCQAPTLSIVYTATAWEGLPADPASRTHSNIKIFVDGEYRESGEFTAANNFSFSGTLAVPAGKSPGDPIVVTALAEGPWGNGVGGGESTSTTIFVPDTACGSEPGGVGRFTGGGKSIDVATGLKVTKGFTIHCDLILSNNLEINWPGAGRTNQFHMLQHTQARCTDDLQIEQRPPASPVDRIDGIGTGRYNGVAGYSVAFTLIDAGEPGTSDQIGFRVFETANPGNVVLVLPLQNIIGGNVQAHYDQPHKK
jgi:hypothetical protein